MREEGRKALPVPCRLPRAPSARHPKGKTAADPRAAACRLDRHFFTHLPALSSHFMSLALVQSALVFGASFVCAKTGVARATAKVKAIADKTIFIGLLPG